MDPFQEFNHFITYFIPGVVLFIVVLMVVSVSLGTNLIKDSYFSSDIFVTIIAATILGLFLDESRHTFLEKWFEEIVTKIYKINLKGIDGDFVSHTNKVGVDVYKLIRDENFYFYEFDINICFVFLAAALCIPFYLAKFYPSNMNWWIIISVVCLALCCLFWIYGMSAYKDFLTAFSDTVKKVKKFK